MQGDAIKCDIVFMYLQFSYKGRDQWKYDHVIKEWFAWKAEDYRYIL